MYEYARGISLKVKIIATLQKYLELEKKSKIAVTI